MVGLGRDVMSLGGLGSAGRSSWAGLAELGWDGLDWTGLGWSGMVGLGWAGLGWL